jgi:hypothetical protein
MLFHSHRNLLTNLVNECYQGVFLMLPPLLSIHELQIALPSSESLWSSTYEQWRYQPPPSSTTFVCSAIARVSAGATTQKDLEQPTRLITLFTAFVQHLASQNLMRVMVPHSEAANSAASAPILDPTESLWKKAFDSLSKAGCSQPCNPPEADGKPNEFAVAARLLTILTFTPQRLLLPFSKWQTSAHGYGTARKELIDILSNDAPRARYCLYLAAQLFRRFRSAQASTFFDTLAFLMCVLYIVSYIELVELQNPNIASRADGIGVAKVIRLDQAISDEERDSWLHLRCQYRPHVAGIGLLGTDRSVARVFKEASQVMVGNGPMSTLAKAMSTIFTSSATGRPPDFPHDQSEPHVSSSVRT